MSLLDRGTVPCKIYPTVTVTDSDGNTVTRASQTPIETVGRFWPQVQSSGSTNPYMEEEKIGFLTEQFYTAQFPRAVEEEFGPFNPMSKVSWGPSGASGRERVWEIFGQPIVYNGSAKTKHTTYMLRRA